MKGEDLIKYIQDNKLEYADILIVFPRCVEGTVDGTMSQYVEIRDVSNYRMDIIIDVGKW